MKKLLSVTFFTALLTLLRMASGFVIGKVIAIYTGPAGLALLSQLQNLSTLINGLLNAPVTTGIVRYTAEKGDDSEQNFENLCSWWKAGLTSSLIGCVVLIPLMMIFAPVISNYLFNAEDYKGLIVLIAFFSPFSILGTLSLSILNGLHQYKKYIYVSMIAVLLTACVMIFSTVMYGVKGALLAGAIQNSIIGLIVIISVLNQKWFRPYYLIGKSNVGSFGDISKYIIMAVVSAIAIPATQISIRYLMSNRLGWDVTGQWQAVWKISEVYLSVITLSLSTYFLPKLAGLKNLNEIKNEINKTALIIVPIVCAMAIFIYFSRDLIISILFTKEFYAAREYFSVQLLGDVIKIISWLYAYPMLSKAAVKYYVTTEILFSFIFILLSVFFIEKYQAHGVNIAYVATYTLYLLTMLCCINKFAK